MFSLKKMLDSCFLVSSDRIFYKKHLMPGSKNFGPSRMARHYSLNKKLHLKDTSTVIYIQSCDVIVTNQ